MQFYKISLNNIFLYPDTDRFVERLLKNDLVIKDLDKCKEKIEEELKETNQSLITATDLNDQILDNFFNFYFEFYYDYLAPLVNDYLYKESRSEKFMHKLCTACKADIYTMDDDDIKIITKENNFEQDNFMNELYKLIDEIYNKKIDDFVEEAVNSIEPYNIITSLNVTIPINIQAIKSIISVDCDSSIDTQIL